MRPLLKLGFFGLMVRPVLFVLLGIHVRHRERLPTAGPAVVVANHNSHLDALILMSLFPLESLSVVRPVGAQDYFHRGPLSRFFSTKLLGLIPLARTPGREEVAKLLRPCEEALERGEILIIFPEGTRGDAERRSRIKGGVARLWEAFPEVPVVPVFLRGAGKCLPRGEALLVPLNCDAVCGEAMRIVPGEATRKGFCEALEKCLTDLESELPPMDWE